MAAKSIAGILLLLATIAPAAAEVGCRPNSDGSAESYLTEDGVSIKAYGSMALCNADRPPLVIGNDPPPPPTQEAWVPATPTARWYVDLWVSGAGPRGALECYEFDAVVGLCKWRSPWICNTGELELTVSIDLDGGSGIGQPSSQMNGQIAVRHEDGQAIEWPAHANNAAIVIAGGTSQHNAVMTADVAANQCYRAFAYIGRPVKWFERTR